jgi:hypothetical protein
MTTHLVSTVLILFVAISGAIVGPPAIEYISGCMVIDYGVPMFQLNGMIFGGYSDHEYGHSLQQREMGDVAYYASVVAPSVATNMIWGVSAYVFDTWLFRPDEYTDFCPWEADANMRVMEYNR